jgi:hypothetical protein
MPCREKEEEEEEGHQLLRMDGFMIINFLGKEK